MTQKPFDFSLPLIGLVSMVALVALVAMTLNFRLAPAQEANVAGEGFSAPPLERFQSPPPLAQPSGSLSVAPSPCEIETGEGGCDVTLSWETSGLADDERVQVIMHGRQGEEWIFACQPGNRVASWSTSGGKIKEWPRTFSLHVATGCDSIDQRTRFLGDVTIIGNKATATGPVCDLTNMPMEKVDPGYMMMDIYDLQVFWKDEQIAQRTEYASVEELYQDVAQKMAAAGIQYVHKPLEWREIQTLPGEPFDYTDFDRLFNILHQHGVKPLIELRKPPVSLSVCPTPTAECSNRHGQFGAASMAEWENYVETTVNRYKHMTDRWIIWEEPDSTHSFMVLDHDNRPVEEHAEEYVLLLNAAYAVIKRADPDAIVIAPGVNVAHWMMNPQSKNSRWISYVAQHGDFDVFSIHSFFEDDVAGMIDVYRYVEGLLVQKGVTAPISITSIQKHGREDDWPRMTHCPFLEGDEEVQAEELTRLYACFANEGVHSLSYHRISDSRTVLHPCTADNLAWCTCQEPGSQYYSEDWPDCDCANPQPETCPFWCPPNGVDYHGILTYKEDSPAYDLKPSYYAFQEIAEFLTS